MNTGIIAKVAKFNQTEFTDQGVGIDHSNPTIDKNINGTQTQ